MYIILKINVFRKSNVTNHLKIDTNLSNDRINCHYHYHTYAVVVFVRVLSEK